MPDAQPRRSSFLILSDVQWKFLSQFVLDFRAEIRDQHNYTSKYLSLFYFSWMKKQTNNAFPTSVTKWAFWTSTKQLKGAPERDICSLTNLQRVLLGWHLLWISCCTMSRIERCGWVMVLQLMKMHTNDELFYLKTMGANSSRLISNTVARFLLLFSFLCDHQLVA